MTLTPPLPSDCAAACPWLPALHEQLVEHFRRSAPDGAHDLSHVHRVARRAWAMALEEGPGVSAPTVLAAALMHDLVQLPKNHPESSRCAERSAELARQWCAELPGLAPLAEGVAAAVRTHSFSAGLPPASPEAALLQDADRLDALGAIGIARCFATGGAMGIRMWNAEDPWGRARPLDDKRHSLDHFPLKLLKLAKGMNTEAGRRRARRREATLRSFLDALQEELE